MSKRNEKTGRFTKTLKIWDNTNWNDGWHDNKGRFRVYRPDYPRAYSGGYALRAHIVWWLAHNSCHPKGTNLHHKNHIKDDDRLENLEIIDHGNHSSLHNKKTGVMFLCEGCNTKFYLPKWRVRQRKKQGYLPRFCSMKCRDSIPHSKQHKENISKGLHAAYKQGNGPAQKRQF